MLEEPEPRTWIGPRGRRYRVRLCPLELPYSGGIAPGLSALVYEGEDGSWAGSVPVFRAVRFWSLSDADLRAYFRRIR